MIDMYAQGCSHRDLLSAPERQQGSKAPKTFLKFAAWFVGPGRLKAQLPNFFHGLKPRSPPAKLRLGCAGMCWVSNWLVFLGSVGLRSLEMSNPNQAIAIRVTGPRNSKSSRISCKRKATPPAKRTNMMKAEDKELQANWSSKHKFFQMATWAKHAHKSVVQHLTVILFITFHGFPEQIPQQAAPPSAWAAGLACRYASAGVASHSGEQHTAANRSPQVGGVSATQEPAKLHWTAINCDEQQWTATCLFSAGRYILSIIQYIIYWITILIIIHQWPVSFKPVVIHFMVSSWVTRLHGGVSPACHEAPWKRRPARVSNEPSLLWKSQFRGIEHIQSKRK